MAVSIGALRVFVAVAEAGAIGPAAERVGRTASAVSMTLKQVEEDIGTALFETERKSSLTPTGRHALDLASDLLDRYEQTLAAIRGFARNEIGRLNLACIPSVALRLLPEILGQYRIRWPGVEIEIRDIDSRAVANAVARGRVEFGIASPIEERSGLRYRPLFEDALGVICRRDDPLAGLDRAVRWSDLDGRPFLANGLCHMIDNAEFRRIVDTAPMTARNVTSVLALLRAGMGPTVLPRLSLPVEDDTLCFLPIEDPGARRRVGLLTRQGDRLSPSADAFMQVLDTALPDMAAALSIDLAAGHGGNGL